MIPTISRKEGSEPRTQPREKYSAEPRSPLHLPKPGGNRNFPVPAEPIGHATNPGLHETPATGVCVQFTRAIELVLFFPSYSWKPAFCVTLFRISPTLYLELPLDISLYFIIPKSCPTHAENEYKSCQCTASSTVRKNWHANCKRYYAKAAAVNLWSRD